jgi:hypothetical protein
MLDFVIFSRPRSGSTMLSNYLNEQTSIACEGEIFHKKCLTFPVIKQFSHWTRKWRQMFKDDALMQRFKNPIGFLSFLRANTDKEILGCKILYYQLHYLKENNIDIFDMMEKSEGKVILLRRRNEFLRNLSGQKAWRVNHPVTLKEQKKILYDTSKKSIDFNIQRYLIDAKNITQADINVEEKLKSRNIPYFITYYEDLTGPDSLEHYNNITTFLGQPTRLFIPLNNSELDIKKQNVFTLEDQISNFDVVKEQLKDDPFFKEALVLNEAKKKKKQLA